VIKEEHIVHKCDVRLSGGRYLFVWTQEGLASFETYGVVMFQVEAFWVVTQCSFVVVFSTLEKENRDTSVGIALGYGLDDRGPERLWGPPILLSNGYQELFPWGKAAGARS
jgi:hypothetical protein